MAIVYTKKFHHMDQEEVCSLLETTGFPMEVVAAFRDEGMDGEAISMAFSICSGPDCLIPVVKKCGLRLKVYNFLKSALETDMDTESVDNQLDILESSSNSKSPLFSFTPTPSITAEPVGGFITPPVSQSMMKSASQSLRTPVKAMTIIPVTGQSMTSFSQTAVIQSAPVNQTPVVQPTTTRKQMDDFNIPDPFPIPLFRSSTQKNLDNGRYTNEDRLYMVRTISTMLCAYCPKPRTVDCEIPARAIYNKYPFTMSIHCWKTYIYSRCININRKRSSESATSVSKKRLEFENSVTENHESSGDEADDEADSVLQQEVAKPNNIKKVKELWIKTYKARRKDILENPRMNILEKYPLIRKAVYICLDFELIQGNKHMKEGFVANWLKWQSSILRYSKSVGSLKHALRDQDTDKDKTALRCVAHLLTKARKEKMKKMIEKFDIPFVLIQTDRDTSYEDSVDKGDNYPHIVEFLDKDDEDMKPQYFISVDLKLCCESSTLLNALFSLVAIHYVFNIEYSHHLKDFYHFLEDKLLEFKSNGHASSHSYDNVISSLACH